MNLLGSTSIKKEDIHGIKQKLEVLTIETLDQLKENLQRIIAEKLVFIFIVILIVKLATLSIIPLLN